MIYAYQPMANSTSVKNHIINAFLAVVCRQDVLLPRQPILGVQRRPHENQGRRRLSKDDQRTMAQLLYSATHRPPCRVTYRQTTTRGPLTRTTFARKRLPHSHLLLHPIIHQILEEHPLMKTRSFNNL